jgi:N-acyl-D-aspartate/D-glutamate deacylase
MRRAALILLVSCSLTACALAPETFDVVLKGGRVIDPETELDGVRDVGIRGDTIVRISPDPLTGARTIDARGLVVAPGFIDLHQHEQSQDAYRLLALDGVTAAFELEVGVPHVRRFIDARRGRSPIHFGASASYLAARLLAWDMSLPPSTIGPEAGIIPQSGPATDEAASPERLAHLLRTLGTEIEAGALGIGVGLEYSPGSTRSDVIELFRLAASRRVPIFIHVRSSGRGELSSSLASFREVIDAATISGAAVHIAHVNSTCGHDATECLSMLASARVRGLDVTTEAYPYTAGMTFINSAVFNPGWREKRGVDYSDLELPESGERLTRERFEELHAGQEPRLVLLHQNTDKIVDAIIADPAVVIASDGFKDHPRGAGTRARVLARYVREQKTITLSDAIRKMSLLPAQRLEKATSDAKRIGRLQGGTQADIVVFDPETIQDRATFRAPTEASVGVRYLIVAGTVVVHGGQIVEGVTPGRAFVSGIDSRQQDR